MILPGVIQHNNDVEELKHNEIPPQHESSQPQEEILAQSRTLNEILAKQHAFTLLNDKRYEEQVELNQI